MKLAGQGSGGPTRPAGVGFDDRGYVLAVLLMSMAVAAVWMAAALPAWRHQAQRERELEAVFRGEQYGRAIALYYVKNSCTLPTDIDVLVSGHYLRKKWKDPIDNDDFIALGGSSTSTPVQSIGSAVQQPQQPQQPAGQVGISAVTPKSTATSIILYNNQQQYNLWVFSYAQALQKMGQNCNRNGQNGGRSGQPGTGTRQGPGGGAPGGGQRPGPGGQGPGGPGPVRPPGPPGSGSGSAGLTPRGPGGAGS